jgi:hypothetical protein
MYNELRYQAKTHAIPEKLSKEKIKFFIFFPKYFFFNMLKKNKQKYNKNMLDKNKCTNTSYHVW